MKIFVGFGYNPRDRWIEELIFPLIIKAFQGEVVDGKEIYGESISDEVRNKIESCDGLLAFCTRRDELAANGLWTTHRWVIDEFNHALAKKIKAVEIREDKVDPQGGIGGNLQHLPFSSDAKEFLILEVAKILGNWKAGIYSKRLQLLPAILIDDVRPLWKDRQDEITCKYNFLVGNNESPPFTSKLRKIGNGLCVDVDNIPSGKNVMIQINVSGPNFYWSSGFESIDLISINMEKNN